MNDRNYLYSSGEFAKLNGINKRTLHYYNDIGLFSPEVTGENGYHYYSCFQTVQLELILTLRRVGMSIEDIKAYLRRPSGAHFSQMVAEQKKLIDASIDQLLAAKSFLQQKSDKLDLALSAVHGQVELLQLPERPILLSAPITGAYDEADFSVAADFSLRLKDLFGLYDNFGSRIDVRHIQQGEFHRYDRFFAYGRQGSDAVDQVLPAGKYLRSFCIGGWELLGQVYDSICQYARQHGLTLYGHAYEEGLNELSLPSREEYVTLVTVPCR